jgi:hypothetical protein
MPDILREDPHISKPLKSHVITWDTFFMLSGVQPVEPGFSGSYI